MQQINISSGSKSVIASGSVILFEGGLVTLNVSDLKFYFEFIDKGAKEDLGINFSQPSAKELKITILNSNNPLGTGNQKPLAVGTINGKPLFLNYRIYSLEGADKTLIYTFYTGEEVVKK